MKTVIIQERNKSLYTFSSVDDNGETEVVYSVTLLTSVYQKCSLNFIYIMKKVENF